MNLRNQKENQSIESKKTTPSKKSKPKPNPSNNPLKINTQKLSQALYSKKEENRPSKVLVYDQFEAEVEDIEGSITSRYQPVETDGEHMTTFRKVNDLNNKRATPAKKKSKEETEKRLTEGRGKKK